MPHYIHEVDRPVPELGLEPGDQVHVFDDGEIAILRFASPEQAAVIRPMLLQLASGDFHHGAFSRLLRPAAPSPSGRPHLRRLK